MPGVAEPGLSLRLTDRRLLELLERFGALPRSDLGTRSGLPRTTVTDSVNRLSRLGLVVEDAAPARPGTTGRRPKLVDLVRRDGSIAVFAFSHLFFRVGVVGLDGTVRAARQVDVALHELTDGPGRSLEALDATLAETGLPRASLEAAVISVPMPLLPGRGPSPTPRRRPTVVDAAVNRRLPAPPAWIVGDDPAQFFGEALGVPAWTENDANLEALAEAAFGAAQDMQDFIWVKLAHGPGGAVVLDGRIHRGRSGLAGEIAHAPMSDEGPMCWCGGRGCLLAKLNPAVIVEDVRPVHPEVATMAEVIALAAGGDAAVVRVLTDVGRAVGRSLATFCAYMNPDGVVLDGELGGGGPAVEAGVREALARFAPPDIARDVRVVSGTLGSQAVLRGASIVARNAMSGHLTSYG